jgi:hypothetical protein
MKIRSQIESIPNNNGGGFFLKNNQDELMIKDVISIVRPQKILEIGFNAGNSSFLWLENSEASVVSVEKNDNDSVQKAANLLTKEFNSRFKLIISDSQEVYNQIKNIQFDIVFIDGDHTEDGVRKDILLAEKLNIPWLFFDDIWDNHDYHPMLRGPYRAAESSNYKEFKRYENRDWCSTQWGNIPCALYKI